jgi:pimeloyl-ACP methyl ester carboxylesterase
MSTFVLIPGASSDSSYWHLVGPRLEAAGHDVVAVDLPCDDDRAGLAEYLAVTLEAIGDRADLVVVAQSLGGFTAPLVADRVPVDLIVLVAAMTPAPGEAPGDWWANTAQAEAMRAAAVRDGRDPEDDDPETLFLHDVPAEAIEETTVRDQSGTPFEKPWPLAAWPDVPTRFLLCRDDRLFPAEFQRRVVQDRLGFVPDEMDGGHLPALARPVELADRLLAYAAEVDVGTESPTAG